MTIINVVAADLVVAGAWPPTAPGLAGAEPARRWCR